MDEALVLPCCLVPVVGQIAVVRILLSRFSNAARDKRWFTLKQAQL